MLGELFFSFVDGVCFKFSVHFLSLFFFCTLQLSVEDLLAMMHVTTIPGKIKSIFSVGNLFP